jgi:SAM-dependent methyltransferase
MTISPESAEPFDAFYFAHGCGRPYQRDEAWFNYFGKVADRIVATIQPGSVLDAGCALGFLVDISDYALQNVHPSVQPYCRKGSVAEPFPRTYDLIVCIEVLEHLPPQESEKAVENICRSTDDVLFSSTPFDYHEATHYNVQPPEYWSELFARQGFFRDVDFDASFITSWALRFRRRNEPVARLVRDYERRFFQVWKENSDLRNLTGELRAQLAASEQTVEALRGQLAEKERVVEQLGAQLHAVVTSRRWRLFDRLRSLLFWKR